MEILVGNAQKSGQIEGKIWIHRPNVYPELGPEDKQNLAVQLPVLSKYVRYLSFRDFSIFRASPHPHDLDSTRRKCKGKTPVTCVCGKRGNNIHKRSPLIERKAQENSRKETESRKEAQNRKNQTNRNNAAALRPMQLDAFTRLCRLVPIAAARSK